jgi:hypothetical protein
MANKKVSAWQYIRTGSGWRYCKPVLGANNKIKPNWVLNQGANVGSVVSKEDITRTPLCLKSRIVRSLYASLSFGFPHSHLRCLRRPLRFLPRSSLTRAVPSQISPVMYPCNFL